MCMWTDAVGLSGQNSRGLVVVHVVERDPRWSRDTNLLRVRRDLLLRVLLKLLLRLPDIRDAQTTVRERAPVKQAARRGRTPPARSPSTSRPRRTARAFHRRTPNLLLPPSDPSFRLLSGRSHTLARAARQRAHSGRATARKHASALGTSRRPGPHQFGGPRHGSLPTHVTDLQPVPRALVSARSAFQGWISHNC